MAKEQTAEERAEERRVRRANMVLAKLDQILEMLLTKTQWINNGLRSYNIDVTVSAGQQIGLECIENVIAIPKQGLKSISFKASGIIERGDLFDMSNFRHYPRTFIGSVDNYDIISSAGVYFGITGVDGEEWSVHDVTTKNQTTLTYNDFSNYRDIVVFGTIGNLKITSAQTKCCTYDIEILYS